MCENNLVRKIARVGSKEVRQEKNAGVKGREGVQISLTERLVRSRLQWTGHVERTTDDGLPNKVVVTRGGQEETSEAKVEMGGCVKREVRKAGEEEDWKKKTRDRGGWKRLSVKKLRAAPHP